MAYDLVGKLMIGGIIAWAKSFTNTPALPASFVECNGQTLSDAQSVYNGQVIPNLNASGGGSKRFLRGSTTSGPTGGAETHTHTRGGAGNVALDECHSFCPKYLAETKSNLPPYYEVVNIMRIK